jgi:hypothetical protein
VKPPRSAHLIDFTIRFAIDLGGTRGSQQLRRDHDFIIPLHIHHNTYILQKFSLYHVIYTIDRQTRQSSQFNLSNPHEDAIIQDNNISFRAHTLRIETDQHGNAKTSPITTAAPKANCASTAC